jgi:hypothetical protein
LPLNGGSDLFLEVTRQRPAGFFVQNRKMKTQDKTLLIIEDSTKNATAMIVEEHEVLEKAQELLKQLAKTHKKARVNVYYPLGIVLRDADATTNKEYAVAYEKEKFIIVAPNGTHESAQLYGNWQEALNYAKKILNCPISAEKKSRFMLSQYVQEL